MELFAEIGHEIAKDPFKYGMEVAQFAALVGIVYFVAVGIGKKRKGVLVNMLAKRRDRVAASIERAETADEQLASAQERAATALDDARAEAGAILADARKVAAVETAQVRSAADAEAAAIRAHAAEVLDAELAEMHVEIRDRLVEVVAHATRSILNEGLTMAEQRDLIQGAVSAGIDRVERALPAEASTPRKAARAPARPGGAR
jgi:F-type H+-transporting ATPase subunit b